MQEALLLCCVTGFIFAQAPDTLWTRTYDGGNTEVGCEVQQTSDDGYIIVGYTNSFGAGGYDVWLLKTDSLGDTLWTKTYGGSLNDYGRSVHQTLDGGYICAGYSNSFSTSGANQIFLIKTNAVGETLWTETYYDTVVANSVRQSLDGGFIVGCTGNLPSWPWAYGFMMKTDVNGNELWTASCTESGADVQQTMDGGYVGVGGFHDSQNFWYPAVCKVDSLGLNGWFVPYFIQIGWGRSIEQTRDEGFIVLAYCSGTMLIKTDEQGNPLWYENYGYSIHGSCVIEASTSGYVITGQYIYGDTSDLYIMRTDSLGDTLWTRTYGDAGVDAGNSIDHTSDGGYIITGCTQDNNLWLLKLALDTCAVDEYYIGKSFTSMQGPTVFRGAILLPEGKKCRVYDITGRVVRPDKIQPGVYFIEIDRVVTQKVVKVR
jgi:hypothetical protein